MIMVVVTLACSVEAAAHNRTAAHTDCGGL